MTFRKYRGQTKNFSQFFKTYIEITHRAHIKHIISPETDQENRTMSENNLPKRKGSKLSITAMITGIASCAAGLVSAWLVFGFAYGRQNQDVIRTAFLSLALVVPALAAIILGIIGKVRGGRIPMLIVTIITAVLTFLFVAFDAYMLIYYIGMTY